MEASREVGKMSKFERFDFFSIFAFLYLSNISSNISDQGEKIERKLVRIDRKFSGIEYKLKQCNSQTTSGSNKPILSPIFEQPITRNVLGNETPEVFYELNGQRYFLSIDGKPVSEYVK